MPQVNLSDTTNIEALQRATRDAMCTETLSCSVVFEEINEAARARERRLDSGANSRRLDDHRSITFRVERVRHAEVAAIETNVDAGLQRSLSRGPLASVAGAVRTGATTFLKLEANVRISTRNAEEGVAPDGTPVTIVPKPPQLILDALEDFDALEAALTDLDIGDDQRHTQCTPSTPSHHAPSCHC